MPRIVLATRNAGKIRELSEMLAGRRIEVLGLADFEPYGEVAETGGSFVANAMIKAHAAASASGLPALADDSGLCIDALDGRPGVDSAIYGGLGLTDEDRVRVVLDELAALGLTRSSGRFVCVMALATPPGEERFVEAAWEGLVAGPPRGTNGFGYDPIFEVPGCGLTAAELPSDRKNQLSHRGQALRLMLELFDRESYLLRR